MNVKEQIIQTLQSTQRGGIEKVIDYMEQNEFFTKSCHRHHHYTGGLADHAWQTYQWALELADEGGTATQGLDKNSLAICALLHDFCNCSGLHHVSPHRHGQRSAAMLKELGFHLSIDEFLAIRFHMGWRRKQSHPRYQEACKCMLLRVIHQADYNSASSQRGCELPS